MGNIAVISTIRLLTDAYLSSPRAWDMRSHTASCGKAIFWPQCGEFLCNIGRSSFLSNDIRLDFHTSEPHSGSIWCKSQPGTVLAQIFYVFLTSFGPLRAIKYATTYSLSHLPWYIIYVTTAYRLTLQNLASWDGVTSSGTTKASEGYVENPWCKALSVVCVTWEKRIAHL
jgi:hypothetical protein